MSQKTTKKKREKGPKYHRWNPTKQIYEIRKPYQLDHVADKPNARIMPMGMKQLLIERGIWQDYLDYFQKKNLAYEEYDDIGATFAEEPEQMEVESTALTTIKIRPKTKPKPLPEYKPIPKHNVTKKRRLKVVPQVLQTVAPAAVPVSIAEPEPEPPKDLSQPLPDDISTIIPDKLPEEKREPKPAVEEKPKSLIQKISEDIQSIFTGSPVEKPLEEVKEEEPEEVKEEALEEAPEEAPEEVKEEASEEVKEELSEEPSEEAPEEYIKESVIAPTETPEVISKPDTTENITYDFLYPNLDDPNFNKKLAKHKEFYDTQYDGKIYDFKKHAEVLCNASFELMPHQIFVKNFLSSQTPYNSLLLYAGLGTGKCHKKDTPIMLFDGNVKMVQDIEVGDLLMGDDSTPRTVTSLARGRDKMYDIIPVKGEKYTVNEEHILCLKVSGYPKMFKSKRRIIINWIENNSYKYKSYTINNKNIELHKSIEEKANQFYNDILNNKNTNNSIIEISVKDYLKLSKRKTANLKGYKVPVFFPEKELPFDPYMIGYWLGDGSCTHPEITCQDSTVLYYFAKNLPKYNLSLSYYSGYNYGIIESASTIPPQKSPSDEDSLCSSSLLANTANKGLKGNVFLNTLKDLNIYDNKHIPYIYKCNSRQNRLELLAGLLDSDGYLDPNSNGFEFTQKNEKLMDDVIYLARSLGFSCWRIEGGTKSHTQDEIRMRTESECEYKKEKKTSWTYNNIKKYSSAFRIFISGEGIEEIPTKIPRKKSKSREQIKDTLVSGITVKYVNEDDYYGFTLDGNCRYLMGDFTVTHNTCAAIGVAEEARAIMKQSGLTKSIFIIASPNVQDNFRLQLFDDTKLKYENGIWNIRSCVGEALLKEINPTFFKHMSKERVINQIKSIINEHYVFMGYTQFANFISDSIEAKGIGYSKEEKAKIRIKKIRAIFNNRLVIIDEVHNIRITHENKNKKTAELLMQVARYANNMRFLLLSATPMYNSHEEIIWLANLMNLNDKRTPIRISDVFDKYGNFVEAGGKYEENGRDLLVRKLTGYVSYVRGENPYSFPFRIYPVERPFMTDSYPALQMNGKPLDPEKALKHIPIVLDELEDYQQQVYDFIVQYLFHEDASYKKTIANSSLSSGGGDAADTDIDFIKMDTYRYTQLQRPLEALNIVFPSTKFQNAANTTSEERGLIITEMLGTSGLENTLSYKEHTKDYSLKYNYEYKPEILESFGRIFSPEKIGSYSTKIANICDSIRISEGIILVYSQWIDGGVIPMALALEEMGFTRYGTEDYTRPLFKTPPTEPIDSLTMKSKSEFGEQSGFRQAKYMIITGESAFSPNNMEDIKYLNQPKNKMGEFVKVVIISKAAAEGIDFKNIRQIHVMEPWFNMNRVEQIIGRGVRNLSHCGLPFEKRNVEIFLHSGVYQDNHTETADLYIYRLAEQKSIKIGNVSRLIKETAVDCILNIAQTNYTTASLEQLSKNPPVVQIQTASGKTMDYTIGDKPFTEMCDYKDNCNYQCSPSGTELQEVDIIHSTYDESFLHGNRERILKRIRELYREIPLGARTFYQIDKLIAAINIIKKYPLDQIYGALTYLIENKNEYLIDRYGRKGNMINHGDYYIFQPIEITDEYSSIYERSRPVDIKPKSVIVKLSKESAAATQAATIISREPTEEITQIEPMEQQMKIIAIDNFDTLYQRLKENYQMAWTESTDKIPAGERNWYKNFNAVARHLQEKYTMERTQLEKYVIIHIFEEISFDETLVLLNKIYNKTAPWHPIETFDTYMKEYYDGRMIVSDRGIVGIVLSEDGKTTKIFTQSTEEGKWQPAEYTQSTALIRSLDYSSKHIFNKDSLERIIGFMSWVEAQNEYIFKVRDTTDAVNKRGARVNQATAKDIITRINMVVGEQAYTTESVKEIFGDGKNRLVVILEMVLRFYQDIQKNSKLWVLTNEQVLINGILQWTRGVAKQN